MNQIKIYDESKKRMAESFKALSTTTLDAAWEKISEDIGLLYKIYLLLVL